VKTILGLALDFYNVKQSLHTGGTSAAIKARCEAEINRIEKQFDDCVAFLLRVCLLETFLKAMTNFITLLLVVSLFFWDKLIVGPLKVTNS
jgi:hypothetical protein